MRRLAPSRPAGRPPATAPFVPDLLEYGGAFNWLPRGDHRAGY